MQTDFDIPKTVAICPCCGGALSLEVSEWESETGAPTEAGCYVDCDKHCTLGYGTGVALTARVHAWAAGNVVVRETKEMLLRKWVEWEAGKPMKGGMGYGSR
jgi:hypothetical protein